MMAPRTTLVLLAQQVLLHLAHRVARQFVGTTKQRFGILKLAIFDFSSATIAAPSSAAPGSGDHDGDADLAEVRVRHADHGALGHAGHLVDVALDLRRIDVVAAADDQVLAAADDA